MSSCSASSVAALQFLRTWFHQLPRQKGPQCTPTVTSGTSKDHEICLYFRTDPLEEDPGLVLNLSIDVESTSKH